MKAYKAFNTDLTCRGVQYAVGETVTHSGPLVLCESGLHACLSLIDVVKFYPLTDCVLAEVDIQDYIGPEPGCSKVAARSLTVLRLLTLADFCKLAASGNESTLAAAGGNSAIVASGRDSRAKGAKGTWIALISYNEEGQPNGVASGCVGQDGIKPDTWYKAINGRLVEVQDSAD